MWDSTTPEAIPVDAEVIAGYDDGALYSWPDSAWQRFSGAKVRITATGQTLTSDVADVEWGDMTPAGAAAWQSQRAAAGFPQGVVYCSLSKVMDVLARCGPTRLWVAHYTYTAHLCSSQCLRDEGWAGEIPDGLVVATQYANRGPNGENVDMSLCAGWPA